MKHDAVRIVMPRGMAGACNDDSPLESFLRQLAAKHGTEDEWAEKYGTNFENGTFMMHQFCWCGRDDCPWCRENDKAPNFHYKPLGLKVWWYKYIGRDMEMTGDLTPEQFEKMKADCLGGQIHETRCQSGNGWKSQKMMG